MPVAPPQEEPAQNLPLAPEHATTDRSPTSDLLLGRGARFEGRLTFEGTVRIDSVFIGSITTNDVLVVGESARIDGDITCGTVIVHGEVNGRIEAKAAVEIHRPAKVRADLQTPSLSIARGALFQGECRMDQAPPGTAAKIIKGVN
jgi:cytoskeletal protein CcmA (bactofilin family)